MDGTPPPSLIQHDMQQQQRQLGYPSPVSPGQSPQHTLVLEQQCFAFLQESMTHRDNRIRTLGSELHEQKAASERNEAIIRDNLEAAHEEAIARLNRTIDRLQAKKTEEDLAHTEQLQDLERIHARDIKQIGEATRLEAQQTAVEHEQEVEELNSTYEQEKREYEGSIDDLTTQVTSLQHGATKTEAAIDALKDKNAKLEEAAETQDQDSVAQADKIAQLERELGTVNDALQQVRAESESDTARLQSELNTAGTMVEELIGRNESLTTQRSIDKIVYEQAQAAQKLAEEKSASMDKENHELRMTICKLEEADRAAEELRKEFTATQEEHRLRETEVVELKADNLSLTSSLNAGKEAQTAQATALAETQIRLDERREEAQHLQATNQELMSKCEAGEKKVGDLEAHLKAEKDALRLAEEKRAKEQKEVIRLGKCLAASKMGAEESVKKLSDSNAALNTISAELQEEKIKLSTALKDSTEAANNAATHLKAKLEAEAQLKEAKSSLDNISKNDGVLRQQRHSARQELATTSQQLETARKQPQELQLRLNETRNKLRDCGSNLHNSVTRTVKLSEENRDLADKNRDLDEENKDLRAFRTEMEKFGEAIWMGTASSGMKRTRDNESHESDRGSDNGQSSAKRLRVESESSTSAPHRHDDRPTFGFPPRGSEWSPDRMALGNGGRAPGR